MLGTGRLTGAWKFIGHQPDTEDLIDSLHGRREVCKRQVATKPGTELACSFDNMPLVFCSLAA